MTEAARDDLVDGVALGHNENAGSEVIEEAGLEILISHRFKFPQCWNVERHREHLGSVSTPPKFYDYVGTKILTVSFKKTV